MSDTLDKKHDDESKHVEDDDEEKKDSGNVLSHSRVKRIIKSDTEIKQIANDAVYLISRATVRLSRY